MGRGRDVGSRMRRWGHNGARRGHDGGEGEAGAWLRRRDERGARAWARAAAARRGRGRARGNVGAGAAATRRRG
jgi:hypothetical protein